MIQKIRTTIIAFGCFFAGPHIAGADELPPDDPGITGDLSLWLRNADIDYDAGSGLWLDSSGNGNNAGGIGTIGDVDWSTPSLALIDGGGLSPNELDSVRFAGGTNDILAATGLNGDSGLSELTIIAVYAVSDRQNLTRPLGFGSIAATQANAGNHFNLASDPSIRKDNGQIGSGSYDGSVPLDTPFIRSVRMDAGGIDEWFNSDGEPVSVLTNAGPAYTTSNDVFYLGDLRAGATAVPGFGGISTADIDVIEVIVYKTALTDGQIADINEWLVANIGGVPAPRINSFTATPSLIASGGSSRLDWDVERADTVSISPSIGGVDFVGNTAISPISTTTYLLTATGPGGITSGEITIGVDVPLDDPVISEIVAINNNVLDDEDGESSDWIEIHNPNTFDLDLGGYYLTDASLTQTKWQLPAGTVLAGGGHLIIFASGKDRTTAGAELHTNFNLSSNGEDLRLYAPNGTTLVSQLTFPTQISDIAYGTDDTGAVRFITPSPGAPNGTGFDGKVEDTKFSINRGFFATPQNIAITSATPGAEIRFTTDGSEPGESHGTIYEAPVSVTTTTTLRAAAFKNGLLPTNVDTHTYLYLDDVIRQPSNPAGAPSSWGNRSADYAMDPDVVDDPDYRGEIINALRSIRTLSIVVPNDEFFNNPRGIYANPGGEGRAWEREVSFEFLHPDDATNDHQTNCGIRIHGNGSRSANGQPKHGFRVEFRGEYGSKNLNYQLFPDINVEQFDSIILRGQNAHGWTRSSQISNNVGTSEREQSQYIRDSFARDIMKDMGQTSGEATYVHLYINGLYWGLYNPVEYPRAAYGESHFGGSDEEYDSINRRTTTTKILDGTFEAWDEMQALANSGLTTRAKYEEMETHMNIGNLIDYMLMHQYMGSRDGPEVFNSNNMRAIRKSRGDNLTTWIGMPWDMEASMFETDVTRNVNVDDPSTLVRVYTRLRGNPEFRLRYADHVRRHFFNGGTLTPARAAAIWEVRANEIYSAIIGESARWGDYRRATHPFTRDDEWQQERSRLLNSYFPTRTEFLINLLRDNDLYPDTEAPDFTQAGFQVTITAPAGTIYFTTDGSDPREMWSGDVIGAEYTGPLDLGQSTTVKSRVLNGGEWSALTEETFLVGTLASSSNIAVSELMYHPAGDGAEFLELTNISPGPVDLSGVHFDSGIDFTAPTGTIIPAGGFFLITDFENGTALDNSGELITLLAADESIIESFRYDDAAPWPESPDGLGSSLTRILPPGPPNDPASWRSSVGPGGSAGTTDAVPFTGDPEADRDFDGLSALIEHGYGTDDNVPNLEGDLFMISLDGTLNLSLQQNLAADDIVWSFEHSPDLQTWLPAGVDLIFRSTTDNGDGTATLQFSSTAGLMERHFWRARATRR